MEPREAQKLLDEVEQELAELGERAVRRDTAIKAAVPALERTIDLLPDGGIKGRLLAVLTVLQQGISDGGF